MKKRVIATLVAAASGSAYAGTFDFKDVQGFEKCMQLDHLVENTKTDTGSQTRYLGPDEIQPRCVAAEVALVSQTKDKELAAQGIKITRRDAGPGLAIDAVGAAVGVGLAVCNDEEAYEILINPISDGFESDWGKKHAIPVIKRCLKDNEFKKDFLEEKDSPDAARAKNACQILLDEKLVKACKRGK